MQQMKIQQSAMLGYYFTNPNQDMKV